MAKSRLIGSYPVIGIRPTIDGRRGPLKVRESLEVQTMNMAKSAQKLIQENVFYSNGEPVKVVIADTTIGRVAEAAACADKFKKEGVDITITVTPCWCYGSETMDMDPLTIKAVWGFNGTERPGAVYLAAVLAGHAQKGLPAFGIYGHDVQDLDDTSIPCDVAEKLLRFSRAAVAVATMRGKSYLQIGSICMGIAGSIVDVNMFEEYLGMRVESVDEVEIIRRMTEGIYDEKEYQKALAWVKEKCNADFDKNPENLQRTAEEKAKDWEFTAKMACIIKDLMNGNPNLPKGAEEEMVGHNAIAAGFQGQRQWTVSIPDDVTDKLWKRTDYTWPCTWFAPRCTGKGAFKTAYDVMNNWGANHGAISYGHIGADLITMCSMLRIPVCMHNVDEKDIYRPASWNAFGMDKEGQDYRACQAYGPMYKNIK